MKEYQTTKYAQVRNILGAFMFSGDDAKKDFGANWWERARVYLAHFIAKPKAILLYSMSPPIT